MLTLPYGRASRALSLGDRRANVVDLPTPPPPRPVRELLDAALDAPIGRPPLEAVARPGARVTVVVSDATRAEPRAELIAAVRARLPDARWTIAIATGTHGPSGIASLGLPPAALAGARVVDHDGHDERELVALGTTSRGTPVRLHRCVVDADLVVATGCIRPHYFAGFGAGVKAVFPGLGAATDIRINHRLKVEPGARAGVVDGNPCRDDLEEAVARLATPVFLVNGVCAGDGTIQAAVAGDPVAAFRAGAERARRWFAVRAAPAPVVVASDVWPVTATLYQSAKIAAAVAPLVAPGGALVVAAACEDGTGPLDTVNEAIFRIGVLPRLAPGVRLCLLSELPAARVRETLLEPIATLDEVAGDPVLVVPRASQVLVEVKP